MAPLSGEPEVRRPPRHTLQLILGRQSSGTAQLLNCNKHICQSQSRIVTHSSKLRSYSSASSAFKKMPSYASVNFVVYLKVLFQQAGRARRSHPEDVGHVATKGSVERTTPAVAASERRKSLKLVRGRYTKRTGKCICLVAHWSFSPPGLSSRVRPLLGVSVSSLQLLWKGCPQDPCQAVEQQLPRGEKHFISLSL